MWNASDVRIQEKSSEEKKRVEQGPRSKGFGGTTSRSRGVIILSIKKAAINCDKAYAEAQGRKEISADVECPRN